MTSATGLTEDQQWLEDVTSGRIPTQSRERAESAGWLARRYGLEPDTALQDYEAIASAYGLTGDSSADAKAIRAHEKVYVNRVVKSRNNATNSVRRGFISEGIQAAQQGAYMQAAFFEAYAKVNKRSLQDTRQENEFVQDLKQIKKLANDGSFTADQLLNTQDLPFGLMPQGGGISKEAAKEAQELVDKWRAVGQASAERQHREFVEELTNSFSLSVAKDIEKARDNFRARYPVEEEFAESLIGQVLQGAGQLGFQIPASMSGPLGLLTIESQVFQGAVDDYLNTKGVTLETASEEQLQEAFKIGGLNALPQVLLEKLGIDAMTSKIFKNGPLSWKQVALRLGLGGFGEGVTEALQGAIQDGIADATFDERDIITKNRFNEFLVGLILGNTVQAGPTLTQKLGESVNKKIQEDAAATIPDSPDNSKPEQIDTIAPGIEGALTTAEFAHIGKSLSEEEIGNHPDADLVRAAFIEGDTAAQDAYNEAYKLEPTAEMIAAKQSEEEKQRARDEEVLQLDGEPDGFAIRVKNEFNLDDKEAMAVSVLADAMQVDKSKIEFGGEIEPEPSLEEQQRILQEERSEAFAELIKDLGIDPTRDELSAVLQRAGLRLPKPDVARQSGEPLSGELQVIWESIEGSNQRKGQRFTKNPVNLDEMRSSLNADYGFDFETVADMLDAIALSFSGEPILPTGRERGGADQLFQESAKDAEYLAAVEAGDMETAQRMVDEAAKAAGYDSPKVYHGTNKEFTKFQPSTIHGSKFFFTTDQELTKSYGKNVISSLLKIKKPFEVTDSLAFSNALHDSDLLKRYDGIVYAGTTEAGNSVDAYVVFSPNQIKSADPVTYDDQGRVIPLSQRFTESTDDIRYQDETGTATPKNAQGKVEFLEDGRAIITALENPNVSTVIHELAHVARRQILNRSVSEENRLGITDDDIAAIEQWAGAKDGVWNRKAEERFARGFERYLRDGESPNNRLSLVFEAMSQWLKRIYDKLTGSPISVKITPEARQVFDKLVTRDQFLATVDPELLEGAEKLRAMKAQGAEVDVLFSSFRDEFKKLVDRENRRIAREKAKKKAAQKKKENQTPEDLAKDVERKQKAKEKRQIRAKERERIKAKNEQDREQLVSVIDEFESMIQTLPLPVRGKLKGFATLAKKRTSQGQRTYLKGRQEQIEKVLNGYLIKIEREKAEKLIEKLNKQIAEAKAGKRKLRFVADEVEEYLSQITTANPENAEVLRKSQERASARLESGDFDDAQEVEGMIHAIDEALEELNKRSIYDPTITWQELRLIRNDLEDILADGRTEWMQRKEDEQTERQENELAILNEIKDSGRKSTMKDVGSGFQDRISKTASELTRPEKIIEIMTGARDSVMKSKIFEPLFDAETRKIVALEKFQRTLDEQMKGLDVKGILGGEVMAKVKGVPITYDEAMAIYAYSQNERGMAHLERTVWNDKKNKEKELPFTPENIEEIIALLPDQNKDVVDRMIDYFDNEQHSRISKVFHIIYGTTMPKEERYFPIVNLDRGNAYMDFLIDYYDASATVQKDFTKGRTGSDRPFEELSFFNTAIRGAVNAEHFIAYAEPLRKVNALLNSKRLKQRLNREHPDLSKALHQWLADVAYGRIRQTAGSYGKWLDILRRNASIAFMGFNLFSALKQPASIFPAMRRGNAGRIISVAARMGNPLEFYKMMESARSKSAFLRNRASNLSAELAEMAQQGQVRSMLRHKKRFNAFQDASFGPIRFLDGITSAIVWQSEYEIAIEKGISEPDAIKKADILVRNTQSTGDLLNSAQMYRRGGWEKAMVTFTTDINMAMNNLVADYYAKDRDLRKMLLSVGMYLILPAIHMAAVNILRQETWYELGEDDEDLEASDIVREVGGEFLGQVLGGVPLLNAMVIGSYYVATGDNGKAIFAGDTSSVAVAGIEGFGKGDVLFGSMIIAGVPGVPFIRKLYKLLVEDED